MELPQLPATGPARRRESDGLLALNRAGLSLTYEETLALMARRDQALRQTGRLEFGGGVLQKLLLAFQDSPFLPPESYADTLGELTEVFYYVKNECMDRLTDDELLSAMRVGFDGICRGSVELLEGLVLPELCQKVREGRPRYREEESDDDDLD